MIKKTKWKQMMQQIQGNWEGEKGVTKGVKVNFYLPTGDHWLQNDLPCACWSVWK